MARTVLLLFAWCLAWPAAVAGQPIGSLKAEDHVRLSSSLARGTFMVVVVEHDAIVVRKKSWSSPLRVPFSAIQRVDVSRGRLPADERALRGAAVGLLVGAATGAALRLSSEDDSGNPFRSGSGQDEAAVGGAVLGLTGAVVGGVLGLISPGNRWERLELSGRLGVAAGPDGGWALAYSRTF